MYAGQVVEQGASETLFVHPTHPYTAGLLASIPRLGEARRLRAIPGVVPAPGSIPVGCRFHARCEYAQPGRCDVVNPAFVVLDGSVASRCLRIGELTLEGITVP
jgi:oligopeptide/dipeptide ABC transporter ATP-binding protein